MSEKFPLLVTIDTMPMSAPKEAMPLQKILLGGSPIFKTWAQAEAKQGRIRTGVWEATPGVTRSVKGETFEFCHILSGIVEITPDGGKPTTYRAGDNFIMKPGFTGQWRTIETVRKIYVIVT